MDLVSWSSKELREGVVRFSLDLVLRLKQGAAVPSGFFFFPCSLGRWCSSEGAIERCWEVRCCFCEAAVEEERAREQAVYFWVYIAFGFWFWFASCLASEAACCHFVSGWAETGWEQFRCGSHFGCQL